MAQTKTLIRELRARLGRAAVLDGGADLYVHSFDATAAPRLPEVVVIPASGAELAWACERLWAAGIPVTPRGAGTGYSGGAVPARGGAVVVCDRLKEIEDLGGGAVRVGPGVVGDDLNRFLSPAGRFYPVDPASAEVSTLGGHVAENAGGPRALKYGVTRDYVLEIEAISPGRGRERYSGTPGRQDLLSVLVGSEGTLAVSLAITLRGVPAPEAVAAAVATFGDAESAAAAATAVLNEGILPAKLEFVDKRCIECVNAKMPGTFDARAGAALMLEFDGGGGAVAVEMAAAEKLLRLAGAHALESAGDEKGVEKLWRARRGISSALGMLAPHKVNEDVCVPHSRLPALVKFLAALEAEYGVPVPTFGHIGDGNLHVNLMYDRRDKAASGRVVKAAAKLMAFTVSVGGTISGEHGVGLTKAAFLRIEQSGIEREYAGRVKNYFDPEELLNPGKIFTDA